MGKYTIKDILDPVDPKRFWLHYWGKKHLVIRRNIFKTLFKWNDFTNVLNGYPRNLNHLQILDYDGKGTKWCLDKVKKGKLKLPMLKKKEVLDLWRSGKTFVLSMAEYTKQDFVEICDEFEKYFERGQVNIYCSSKKDAVGFPAHCDQTENFLFHTEGKVKWTIYDNSAPERKPGKVIDEFVLEAGDLLYIPQYRYHKAESLTPRISISIHFPNKRNQSLKKFQITKKGAKRDGWYNWMPEDLYYDKKGHSTRDVPRKFRMGGTQWKKTYLPNLKK